MTPERGKTGTSSAAVPAADSSRNKEEKKEEKESRRASDASSDVSVSSDDSATKTCVKGKTLAVPFDAVSAFAFVFDFVFLVLAADS